MRTKDDLERAVEVSALANFNPHPPFFYYYIPQLTEVKLLVMTRQDEKGFQLLEQWIRLGRKSHKENLLIQALALKAVLLQKAGKQPGALMALREALHHSGNKEQIRTFADHGEVMKELLQMIDKDQFEYPLIREVEQAFSRMDPAKVSNPKAIPARCSSPVAITKPSA